MDQKQLSAILSNPELAIKEIKRLESEDSLLAFSKLIWDELEPGRDMKTGWALEAIAEHLEAVTRGDIKQLVINLPPGMMKPVSVDELVTTDVGPVPLSDIKVGDKVLTHVGRFKTVEAVHEQGKLPVVAIDTMFGRRVRMCPTHPVYTSDMKWKKAGKLISGRHGDCAVHVSPGFMIEDPVERVAWAGEAHNRCLTVADDHSFVAGGLAVRNSLLTNVFWPAWIWGPKNQPFKRFMGVSYSQALTVRDNRRFKQVITSPTFNGLWGDRFQISDDEANKVKLSNDKTGFKLATSVGGSVMGERADVVLLDDPNNTKEADSEASIETALQFMSEVLPTRVNDPETSAKVVVMQRVSERDVTGHIISKQLNYEMLTLPMEYELDRKTYTSLRRRGCKKVNWAMLPGLMTVTEEQFDGDKKFDSERQRAAVEEVRISGGKSSLLWKEGYLQDRRKKEGDLLFPERFPGHYLENELKKEMRSWGGEFAVSGQLQQRPLSRGGSLFQRETLPIISLREVPEAGTVIRAWDLASSTSKRADYTVGVKVRRTPNGVFIIENVIRFKGSPNLRDQKMREVAEMDGRNVPVSIPQDPGQAGKSQKAHLATILAGYKFRFSPESGSKETRAQGLAAQAEAGNVFLVRGSWNEAFYQEAESFPRGQHDDQIDAASRAYGELLKRKKKGNIFCPPMIISPFNG